MAIYTVLLAVGILALSCQGFLVEDAKKGVATRSSSSSCSKYVNVGAVAQELWDNDVNRIAGSDLKVNFQQKVKDHTTTDHAPQKFFTYVNDNKLRGETYQTMIALLDNFNPTKGRLETVTPEDKREDEAFIDAILKTSVMKTLENYLTCQNEVKSHEDFKSLLYRIWFGIFSRSSRINVDDTCGFEHVFVGEFKDRNEVNGFHNWVRFYQQEKIGTLDYFGYVSRDQLDKGTGVVGLSFKWKGHYKTKGSFFLGVSPEFDVAIYTLCLVKYPNDLCPITINSKSLKIKTFKEASHLSTAFVQ